MVVNETRATSCVRRPTRHRLSDVARYGVPIVYCFSAVSVALPVRALKAFDDVERSMWSFIVVHIVVADDDFLIVALALVYLADLPRKFVNVVDEFVLVTIRQRLVCRIARSCVVVIIEENGVPSLEILDNFDSLGGSEIVLE